MEDILISSPLFDPEKSKQYYLSIQLGLDGFSFCIIDTVSNKLIYLNHLPGVFQEHFDTFIADHDVLSLSFGRTDLMICDNKVTASPNGFCTKDNVKSIYELSNVLDPNDLLLTDVQENTGMTHIYAVASDLDASLRKFFPKLRIHHHQSIMTMKALLFNPSLHEERVYLTIWNRTFHMLVVKGEKLVFMNQFDYQNIDDFLYFFLYTFKQMDLDPEVSRVIVHGKIFKQSILLANLKKYVRKVEFSSWPNNINYSNAVLELQGHYFSNLCLLHLCE